METGQASTQAAQVVHCHSDSGLSAGRVSMIGSAGPLSGSDAAFEAADRTETSAS